MVTSKTVVLAGPHAGRTMSIRQWDFVGGRCQITGDEKQLAAILKYLATYQAYPEGAPELESADGIRDPVPAPEAGNPEEILDGLRPDGSWAGEEADPVGQGHDGPAPREEGASAARSGEGAPLRIRQALSVLDPEDDECWTTIGWPRMDALAKILGDESVKRADVEAAWPEFDREMARVAKAGKED